jgi:hypothetical protein
MVTRCNFPTASRFNVRSTRGAEWLGEAERRQTTRTPLSRHFINGISHKRTRRHVTAIAALLAKADIGATDCAYTPR